MKRPRPSTDCGIFQSYVISGSAGSASRCAFATASAYAFAEMPIHILFPLLDYFTQQLILFFFTTSFRSTPS